MSDYPKCKTCEHYSGDSESGTCKKLYAGVGPDEVKIVTARVHHNVLVPADFGCLLHSDLNQPERDE